MQRNHRRSRALALLLLLVIVAGLTAALQLLFTSFGVSADDTGWQNPRSDNATTAGTGRDGFEINPQYAYTDDNLSAENHGGLGDSHLFYNFGLDVPLDATVKGIQVRLDWYLNSDAGINSMGVELSWNGGSDWTSPATDGTETVLEHTANLGSSSDNWGHSWTPNEFTNDNLRVRITCNSDEVGRVFYLEYVSVIVYYAPVRYLEVIGDSTMTAGGSNVLTIRAIDKLGDTAVNYSGPKSLTFSGPAPAPGGQIPTVGGTDIGVPVSVTFTNGVSDNATTTTLLAYRSELTTVHVTDGTSDSFTTGSYGLALTVSAAAAARIDLTPNGGSATAGSPFDFTVTAYDAYGNIATSYTGNVHFTSTDSAATLPVDHAFTAADNGSHTFTGGITLRTSGNQTVSATDIPNTVLTDTETWAVSAGPLNHHEVTSASYSQTAGISFTVTVTAHDQFHNLVNDSTTSVTMTSNSPTMLFDGNSNSIFGEAGDNVKVLTAGTFTITARDTAAATGITIIATGGGASGTGPDYTISAGPLDHYEVTSASYSQTAGVPFTVIVNAHDQFHNLVNDGATSVTMTSSSLTMAFDANGDGTYGDNSKILANGALTITARDTTTASGVTITATDASLRTGANSFYTINPGPIDHYTVRSASYTQTAGVAFTITVTAYDAFGNVVTTDSTTSITMTSNSPTMLFDASGNSVFGEPGDNIKVLTAGTFTITARDTTAATGPTITATSGGVQGTSLSYTVGAGPLNHYDVTSASYSQTAGISFPVTVNAHDQFHNLVNDNTTSVTMTSSSPTMLFDANGNSTFGESGDNIKVLTAGTFSITAMDTTAATGVTITAAGGSASGTSPGYTISSGPLNHYEVTSASYSQTAGMTFTVTVTAHDQFHNLVNDSSTSVTMTSGSPTMLFDANGDGTYGDNSKTLSSGSLTINARDTAAETGVTMTATGGAAGTSPAYTITAGGINHYEVTSASYSQAVSAPFTVTVTAHDQFHNLVNDSTTSVTMTSSSPTMLFDASGNGTFGEPGDNVKVLTAGIFAITARDTSASTGVTITATGGGASGVSFGYTISAGPLNHYEVTSASYSQTAGVSFTATVTAHDQFHNLVNDSTTFITMTSSSPTMLFDGNGNSTFGEPGDNVKVLTVGTFTITARDTAASSGITITATGGGVSGTSLAFTFTAGGITHYEVTSASYSQTAGTLFTVTVTGHDQFHNLVNDNTTSVTMTSSSPTMLFDGNGNSTFGEPGDNVKVLTAGTFAITARDITAASGITITATGGATGTSLTYTISAGTLNHYDVTSASYSQTAGVPFTVIVIAHDQFHNQVNNSSTSVTVTSSSLTMAFDANGDGTYGDNSKTLTNGALTIAAKDNTAATGITITATGGAAGTSLSYTISAGTLNHYDVTSASYSQTAGVSFAVTVTAHDQFHNLVNDSTTSVTMTSSSPSMAFDANGDDTYGDNSKTLTSGAFTITARDNTAATGVIITAAGGSASGTSPAHTISAGPLNHYDVTSSSYSQAVGVPFNVTVTAHDLFHNLVNDSTTSVTMTSNNSPTMLFDGDSNGTFGEPGDNVKVLTAGTFTITAVDTTAATGVTITATGGAASTSPAYTITTGGIDHYEVTSASYSQTAGVSFAVTVTAHDQFHNVVNDSSTSVTMTSSSPTMFFDGNGNSTFGEPGDNVKVLTAGILTITTRDITATSGITIAAIGGGASGTSLTYTISAGPLNHYEVTSASYSQTAGISFTVTVTAHDQFHNLVNDSSTPVTMTSSSPTMHFDANGNSTFGEPGDNVKVLTAGAFAITARDTSAATGVTITATGGASGVSSGYTISAGPLNHYEVASASYSQTAGISFTVTVTAHDQFHNLVNDSSTSVTITSSSPTMRFDANGNSTFGEPGDNVKVLTAGAFNITARDTSAATGVTLTATGGGVQSTSPVYAISAGPLNHYDVTSTSYSQTVGISFTVTVTAHDQFHNLVNDSTTSVTMTSSSPSMLFDSNGNSAFGEPGDNVKVLTAGTFTITARDTTAATGVAITATGGAAGTSLSYTIGAGSLNHYEVTSSSYTHDAGIPFTVIVTAHDQFHNLVNDNATSVTMTSSSPTMLFDANGNGTFGEAGDNVKVLTVGTLAITARDTAAATGVTITATGGATGTSLGYTIATGGIDHYEVTSASYSQTAGVSFTVTVVAHDQFHNLVNNSTTSVTMTSSSPTMLFDGNGNSTFGEPGDNVKVLTAGTFTITIRDTVAATGVTITAIGGAAASGVSFGYTVSAGPLNHYEITSASYNQAAGASFTVSVTAHDEFHNLVNDSTTSVTMTSSSPTMVFDGDGNGTFGGPGDNINVLTAGTFAITARDTTAATGVTITAIGGGVSGTSLGYTISAGPPHHIAISPASSTVTAGSMQAYTAQSFDQFDNPIADVTSNTVFSIDASAGGNWSANVYTSARAGDWAITGTSVGLTDSASLTVLAGALHHIIISPDNATITAGDSQTYTSQSFDEFENPIGTVPDVTSNTLFSIDVAAGGSWATNVYTSAKAGTWTVTGIYLGLTDAASLTVNAGALHSLTVTSDNYTQQVTVSFTVTVTAHDAFENLVTADNVALTMTSTPSVLIFDGNANGKYGEAGDDAGMLMSGTLDMPAKARSASSSVTITATDGTITGVSASYTIEDFRCFIASAAYGTPMIDQIQVLRDFRDGYLMTNPAGRWFVSKYYRYSPPFARFIAHHDSLRALVRIGLTPVIWLTTLVMKTTLLQKMAMLVSMIAAVSAAVLWLRRRRQSPTS